MTNHDLLAFIHGNGPCNYVDLEFEFGCSASEVFFTTCWIMLYGLLDYDAELGLFSYAGDSWVAQP